MDAEKKDISQPLTSERREEEEKIPQSEHEFFLSFFISKQASSSSSRPKKEQKQLFISQFSFFLSFFFSSKLFCALCVAAPKEREREKSAAGESARKYTHTRLYNNNNKRPSCLKERERENIVCVYCERVVDIQEE
jgi:hypothetical protein